MFVSCFPRAFLIQNVTAKKESPDHTANQLFIKQLALPTKNQHPFHRNTVIYGTLFLIYLFTISAVAVFNSLTIAPSATQKSDTLAAAPHTTITSMIALPSIIAREKSSCPSAASPRFSRTHFLKQRSVPH